jgi:hypothetical protein
MMKITRCPVFVLCALLSLILVAQEPQKNERLEWIKIGMTAQLNNDSFSHVFHVKKNAGAFSKLDLRLDGNLKLDLIIIEYEDGTSWSPKEYSPMPLRWSYLFEHPNSDKRIKTVEIRFHDVFSMATVDLWGGRVKVPKE